MTQKLVLGIKVRGAIQPFALDVKGGEMKVVFPSMPKGEIVGNMANVDCVDCH